MLFHKDGVNYYHNLLLGVLDEVMKNNVVDANRLTLVKEKIDNLSGHMNDIKKHLSKKENFLSNMMKELNETHMKSPGKFKDLEDKEWRSLAEIDTNMKALEAKLKEMYTCAKYLKDKFPKNITKKTAVVQLDTEYVKQISLGVQLLAGIHHHSDLVAHNLKHLYHYLEEWRYLLKHEIELTNDWEKNVRSWIVNPQI